MSSATCGQKREREREKTWQRESGSIWKPAIELHKHLLFCNAGRGYLIARDNIKVGRSDF